MIILLVLWPIAAHIIPGITSWILFYFGVTWTSSKIKLFPRGVKTGRKHPLSIKLRAFHMSPSILILDIFYVIRFIKLFDLYNVIVPFFHRCILLTKEASLPLESPSSIESINDALPTLFKLTPVWDIYTYPSSLYC